MTEPAFRPHPDDPDADLVAGMFDATADEWILTAPGDYHSGAAQAFQADGTTLQNVVVVEWPGRINHTDELVKVRLMMRPADAIGLGTNLLHTGRWMRLRGLE